MARDQRPLPEARGRLPVPRDRPARARVPGGPPERGDHPARHRRRGAADRARRSATPCTARSTRWAPRRPSAATGPSRATTSCATRSREHDFKARGASVAPDEIFVSDGSKCDSGNIQEIFAASARKVAVPDPVYPVYVDTNVMAGRTGAAGESGAYEGIAYLPCTEANGFRAGAAGPSRSTSSTCAPRTTRPARSRPKAELEAWVAGRARTTR